MEDQETPESPAEMSENPTASLDTPEASPELPADSTEDLAASPDDRVSAEVPAIAMDDLLPVEAVPALPLEDVQLQAVLEAIVYVAEEPLTIVQLAASLQQPADRIRGLLQQLTDEFEKPEHGIAIREVAGGFKMATKAEHHDAVRSFVKSLKPPLKLSLPALETLAVIAYTQPVTGPEIQEIRGVQGTGVLKTLLDRKLIAAAGRKNVIGKPILYKTTREFLVQFGLKDLSELPSLKEFEEIRRMALTDEAPSPIESAAPAGHDVAQQEERSAPEPPGEAIDPPAETTDVLGPSNGQPAADAPPVSDIGDDLAGEAAPSEQQVPEPAPGPGEEPAASAEPPATAGVPAAEES